MSLPIDVKTSTKINCTIEPLKILFDVKQKPQPDLCVALEIRILIEN